MLFFITFALAGIALALTGTMFLSRSMMLGFPSAMFWALFGAGCFLLSAVAWDIYYITGFASVLGMTSFCALGAYGLRERKDTIADEEMDEEGEGEGRLLDEAEGVSKSKSTVASGPKTTDDTNWRRRGLHERAAKRRRSKALGRKTGWW